ncbi:MAG: EthD domain-containing protein [Pseudanabaenaceae cyanobacterium bins.68]|nr:EthD domain-containing protein [Pseudanabaenaceae cyanobacterium bins.68]
MAEEIILAIADFSHDYSARDQAGKVVFFVPLWKRKGLDLTLFDDYWRDVHGPVCARLPGQYQYWQFHVSHNLGGIFPQVPGISYHTPDPDQFDGIAELTFKSVADRNTWFQAAAILMDDEHNIFSKAIGYNSSPGNSQTLVDRIPQGDPNGDHPPNLVVLYNLIKAQPQVSADQFRDYLFTQLAPSLATSSHLLKLRLHVFDQVDSSRPPAAGVDHAEPPESSYQACLELAFANGLALEHFFADPIYQATTSTQPQYLSQISTFPLRDAYTFVYDGKITLAGERGSSIAQLITRIGAVNQLQPEITSLFSPGA